MTALTCLLLCIPVAAQEERLCYVVYSETPWDNTQCSLSAPDQYLYVHCLNNCSRYVFAAGTECYKCLPTTGELHGCHIDNRMLPATYQTVGCYGTFSQFFSDAADCMCTGTIRSSPNPVQFSCPNLKTGSGDNIACN